jgi:prolyl-tRNA editing enzyme YbaK/EbsC (Cys-tRNA(Pro) deacylase)
MNRELPNSAKRVQLFLKDKGFDCVVNELPGSTRTAEEAAKSIGCHVAQIAKSLVFVDKITGNPVLVVASGINRVDIKKIENSTGIQLAKADGNFVKEKMGFAIGGVPPVAHYEKVMTYLDPTLKEYESIWAAAGTPFSVFQLNAIDLQKMTDGEFIDLKEA